MSKRKTQIEQAIEALDAEINVLLAAKGKLLQQIESQAKAKAKSKRARVTLVEGSGRSGGVSPQ